MGRRILAPFDRSELGTLAPDRAFEEHPDAEVVAARHRPASVDLRDRGRPDRKGPAGTRTHRPADDRRGRTPRRGTRPDETAIEEGDAGEVIVEYAAEGGTDHVVMGSHGRDRSRLSRVLVGHVAEAVIHDSPIPVTNVR